MTCSRTFIRYELFLLIETRLKYLPRNVMLSKYLMCNDVRKDNSKFAL